MQKTLDTMFDLEIQAHNLLQAWQISKDIGEQEKLREEFYETISQINKAALKILATQNTGKNNIYNYYDHKLWTNEDFII